eukprot:gene5076-848_t
MHYSPGDIAAELAAVRRGLGPVVDAEVAEAVRAAWGPDYRGIDMTEWAQRSCGYYGPVFRWAASGVTPR